MSGFSGQGTNGLGVKIGNNAGYEVVWGAANEAGNSNATGYFNPSTLVLQAPWANPGGNVNFYNKIDLNATTRTIAVNKDPGATTGNATISGVIRTSSGVAGLTKTGPGKLVLSGANTFNGPVTVSQGILSISSISNVASANALGQSSSASSNLLLANGTTLQYTGAAASTDRSFTINGTNPGDSVTFDSSGTGPVNWTNPASPAYGTVGQARTLYLAGSTGGTLAANLPDNGAGQVSITKTGAGIWALSGASSYSGTTTIAAGELSVSASGNLGSALAPLVFNSGGLQVAGTTLTNLSGLGHTIVYTPGQPVTLDIASAANVFTADQAIGGSSFTKTGAGTLVFSPAATHTYTGATTISGGTLQLNTGGVIPPAVPLFDSATLAVNSTGTATEGTQFPWTIYGTGGAREYGHRHADPQRAELLLGYDHRQRGNDLADQ